MTDPGDAALIQRCQAGDQAAFQVVVERYQQRLYAVAYGILHNREDALDAVQTTFIKMHRSLDGFKSQSGLYTWLYRICTNAAIDLHRKRARRPTVEFDEAVGHSAEAGADLVGHHPDDSPRRALANRELGERIREAIAQLPDGQREAIVLREIEGMSYKEIAEALDVSVGTVMSRLHYGRKRLQELLAPYV